MQPLQMALDVGEYENVKFEEVGTFSSDVLKFRLEATLAKSDMNVFLNEYKDEMKRRGVVFPGFRPGKLPPYVMGDVRKYLVSYGLENTIGQLCNFNGLMICGEDGGEVAFGEDEFYKEIIKEDFRGFDFEAQRDAWREGTDFSFIAEFPAKKDDASTGSDDAPIAEESSSVVDAEVVE